MSRRAFAPSGRIAPPNGEVSPFGPIEAFADSLRLSDDALRLSYESLARVGNLSSASILHVLAAGFEQPAGTTGLLFAVGPGVSAEFVLLNWG